MRLFLGVDGFHQLPNGVEARAIAWLARIAPAAREAGLATLEFLGEEVAGVCIVEWEGEGYMVESPAVDEDGQIVQADSGNEIHFVTWVPPEPPPAELMRYAEQLP